MQIKTDRAIQPAGDRLRLRHNHHLPKPAVDERETRRDNDTDRYVLAAQSGLVAGAATEKLGLPIVSMRGSPDFCVGGLW
jgi:hypothetical protein